MFDDFLSSVTWSFNPSQNAVNELTEELKITVARRFDWVVDDPRVVFTLQQAVWIVWERMISRVHERPFLTRVAFDNIRVTDFSARQRRTMTMIRDADMPPERSLLDTFKQYLNIIRITEAKRLLRETDNQITSCAYNVGYNNIPHFNRTFKQLEGISPKEYRKKCGKDGKTDE